MTRYYHNNNVAQQFCCSVAGDLCSDHPSASCPASCSSGGWLLLCHLDVVLRQDRRPGDASVENVGIQVRSVRPSYGAQIRIDTDLREVGPVTQRLEDSLEAEMGREIDHAFNTVLEPKMHAIIAEYFCGNNVLQHDLLQRRNGLELRLGPRQDPILHQLRAMLRRPLRHQAKCARRKTPSQ